jgi:preprotein translocase subunit SecE
VSRPGLSTTGADSDALENDALENGALDIDAPENDSLDNDAPENDAPDPLEHAAPDAELAEAQLALGRPEFAPEPGGEDEEESIEEFELEAEDAAEFYEDQPDAQEALPGIGGRPPRIRRGRSDDSSGDSGDSGGELEAAEAPVPAARANIFSRLIHFVQGSWRELQRVQWPDRRQVMQATGVVIGFVIVAGVFLGVADFLAGKLVNFILK